MESVTQLKQKLEALGISSVTPGLVGDERFEELKHRLDAHNNITKRSSNDNSSSSSSSSSANNGGDASRARQKLETLKKASLANGRQDESGEGDDMFRFDLNDGNELNDMEDDDDDDQNHDDDEDGDEDDAANKGDDTTADEVPTPAPTPNRMIDTSHTTGTGTVATVPPPVGMMAPPKKVPPPPKGAPPAPNPV